MDKRKEANRRVKESITTTLLHLFYDMSLLCYYIFYFYNYIFFLLYNYKIM